MDSFFPLVALAGPDPGWEEPGRVVREGNILSLPQQEADGPGHPLPPTLALPARGRPKPVLLGCGPQAIFSPRRCPPSPCRGSYVQNVQGWAVAGGGRSKAWVPLPPG